MTASCGARCHWQACGFAKEWRRCDRHGRPIGRLSPAYCSPVISLRSTSRNDRNGAPTPPRHVGAAYGCITRRRHPPDPQDSLQNPDLFAGWDEVVEAGHNSRVATQQTFIEVDFQSEYQSPIISPDQTTETRFYVYVLRVSGLVTGDPTAARYTGLADITFRRGTDGQWRMINWADHRGSVSDSTWGLLRSNQRPGP